MEPAAPDTSWSDHRIPGRCGFQRFRVRADNDTVELKLGTGVCIIDAADWPLIQKHKWRACSGGANACIDKKAVMMHALLLGVPAGKQIHHINNNKLDNRRVNLRLRSEKAAKEHTPLPETGARTSWSVHRIAGRHGSQLFRVRDNHTVELKIGTGVCIIDEADWPLIRKHKWRRSANGGADACIDKKTVMMHTLLFAAPEGTKIEHTNKNKLDNRLINLHLRNAKAARTEHTPLPETFTQWRLHTPMRDTKAQWFRYTNGVTVEVKLDDDTVCMLDAKRWEDGMREVHWHAWKPDATKETVYACVERNGKISTMQTRLMLMQHADSEIEHINHNTLDNRWENLRIITSPKKSARAHNTPPKKLTQAATAGVHLIEEADGAGCYEARVRVDGKLISEHFAFTPGVRTKEEAKRAAIAWRRNPV